MGILLHFVVTFIAVFVASAIIPSFFHIGSLASGVVFAAVLAVINAFVRPVVSLLTCPIQLLTFGLATLVVNGLLFWLAASLVPGVFVSGLFGAIVAAIVVSIASWVVGIFVRR